MVPIFERFTDRTRRVLVLAQDEAHRLDDPAIGSEHLLLGLIGEKDGVAGVVLQQMGFSLEKVREHSRIRRGGFAAGGYPPAPPPFTAQAKRVLEVSLREAMQLGHNYIATEHLLLAIVREVECDAAHMLVELGADLGDVRRQVIDKLGGRATPAEPTTSVPEYVEKLKDAARQFGHRRDERLVTATLLLDEVIRLIGVDVPSAGMKLIQAERRRQVLVDRFTAEQAEGYDRSELFAAALCYLGAPGVDVPVPEAWPWANKWWKPKDRVRNLVRAGALLLAEQDRGDTAFIANVAIPFLVDGIAAEIDRLQAEPRGDL